MSEWLMVIVTAIYALLTFLIWKSNKESVREMRLSREVSYRPEVIAYFYEKDRNIHFRIENIGSRMAFNTVVRIKPTFNVYTYLPKNNFMEVHHDDKLGSYDEKIIKILAPQQCLETFVGVQHEIMSNYSNSEDRSILRNSDLEATIELNYSDYENRDKSNTYEEYYEVSLEDFQNHKGKVEYTMHDLVKEFHDFKSEFKKYIRK